MHILRHAHSVFNLDALRRRERAASSDLTTITDDDARLSREVGHGKTAQSRLVEMRLLADGNSFGMGKILP